MDLSSVVPNSTPPRFVNRPLVSLPPVGILNSLNTISVLFVFSIYFVYTAPQACSFKHKPCINIVALHFTTATYLEMVRANLKYFETCDIAGNRMKEPLRILL